MLVCTLYQMTVDKIDRHSFFVLTSNFNKQTNDQSNDLHVDRQDRQSYYVSYYQQKMVETQILIRKSIITTSQITKIFENNYNYMLKIRSQKCGYLQ